MLNLNFLLRTTPQLTRLSLILLGIFLTPQIVQAQKTDIEIIRHSEQQDRVTLRLKVTETGNDKQKRPNTTLKKEDFQLKVNETFGGKIGKLVAPFNPDQGYSDINFRFKTPREAEQPTAYILVLLDMSGSMKCSTDLTSKEVCDNGVPRGKRKLDAAISALETFIDEAKKRKGNTYISIVPFGYGCRYSPIDDVKKLDDFSNVKLDRTKISNKLDELKKKTPCDATNIYHSLEKSVDFLSESTDEKFYPVYQEGHPEEGEPVEPLPRLSVILLTDGFDTQYRSRNAQQNILNQLKETLQNNQQVTIHTLGYGLTPTQLRQKYGSDTIPEEEKLDVVGLEKISQVTTPNGLSEISGNAQEIAEKLQLFLDSILGEYEISYTHPNPERGRKYQVMVSTNNVDSNAKEYRVTVFGRVVSLPIYVGSLVLTILLGGAWFIPYYLWKQKRKEDS